MLLLMIFVYLSVFYRCENPPKKSKKWAILFDGNESQDVILTEAFDQLKKRLS
jgi:hypothetical protein